MPQPPENPRIHALSLHTCNLIAAGEMLDRPAAAAKELMENSIDAGATDVTVEIRGGGIDLLRVTDNGEGIAAGEVATAFLPHTTSKIDPQADLAGIQTLGFRGEALAAIAAVSRVQMLTRTHGAPSGWSYTVEFGRPVEEGEAGCPEGTTVMVRNIFSRLKDRFQQLKSDRAEGAAILDMAAAMAIAHPEVAVRLLWDGKVRFSTPGDGSLENAVYATLGAQFAAGLIPVSGSDGPISVRGYISKPSCCEGTRAHQLFSVNGRCAQGKALSGALESAYQNQIMVGRYPACVLRVDIPYGEVDVNAHPTKTEVRFLNDEDVYRLVFRAAVNALDAGLDRPQVAPAAPTATDSAELRRVKAILDAMDDEPPDLPEDRMFNPMMGPDPWAEQPPLSPSGIPPVPAPEAVPQAPPAAAVPQAAPAAPMPVRPAVPDADPWAGHALPRVPDPLPRDFGEQLSLTPRDPDAPPPWRLVGEVLQTYIIVEQGDTVLLIDKHVAHERLAFDALKAQTWRPMSQELLDPLLLRPGAKLAAALLEHTADLEEFGFELEELGDAVVVRRVPDYLTPPEARSTLEELAQQYLTPGDPDPDSQRDALLRTVACKSAIKGGQRNDPRELLRVAQAVMSGQVTHCPHGRPVAVELPRRTLEREFGRTG